MYTKPVVCGYGITPPVLSGDFVNTNNDGSCLDSQLLKNEPLLLIDEAVAVGWVKVKALFQPAFVNGVWDFCSGFVPRNALQEVDDFPVYTTVIGSSLWAPFYCNTLNMFQHYSLGTPFWGNNSESSEYSIAPRIVESIPKLRDFFVTRLLLFRGAPYVWGGCSGYDQEKKSDVFLTGVDCSALGHLCMRSLGLIIPRNSHAQYLKSISVDDGDSLIVGDAVYIRRYNSEKIFHVYFYLGGEEFIEATGLGLSSKTETRFPEVLATRIVMTHEAFGCKLAQLSNQKEFVRYGEKCVMYLRSFFSTPEYVQSLRDAFFITDHTHSTEPQY